MKRVFLCVLLLAIFVLSACASERLVTKTIIQTQTITVTQPPVTVTTTVTVSPTSPPTTETTFSPITFTGSSDKKTSPFTVTTSEWIIDWSYVPDPEYPEFAVFGFYIYPRGETVSNVESVIFPSSTSGTTYSYAGVGEYYINVTCANVESWRITIRPA